MVAFLEELTARDGIAVRGVDSSVVARRSGQTGGCDGEDEEVRLCKTTYSIVIINATQ